MKDRWLTADNLIVEPDSLILFHGTSGFASLRVQESEPMQGEELNKNVENADRHYACFYADPARTDSG